LKSTENCVFNRWENENICFSNFGSLKSTETDCSSGADRVASVSAISAR